MSACRAGLACGLRKTIGNLVVAVLLVSLFPANNVLAFYHESNIGPGSSGQPPTSGMGQPGMGQPGMGQPGMGQPGSDSSQPRMMGKPGLDKPNMMGKPGMMGKPNLDGRSNWEDEMVDKLDKFEGVEEEEGEEGKRLGEGLGSGKEKWGKLMRPEDGKKIDKKLLPRIRPSGSEKDPSDYGKHPDAAGNEGYMLPPDDMMPLDDMPPDMMPPDMLGGWPGSEDGSDMMPPGIFGGKAPAFVKERFEKVRQRREERMKDEDGGEGRRWGRMGKDDGAGMMRFGEEEKNRVKEMFAEPHKEKIEAFLGDLEEEEKGEFGRLTEDLPMEMRERFAGRLDREEEKEEFKGFLKHSRNFAEDRAREYLEGRLELEEKVDQWEEREEKLKEERPGLRRSLEAIKEARERFIERQPFLRERAEEMKGKMEDLMTKLADEGASEVEMKKGLQQFKQDMMKTARRNFEERLEAGDVPFADTPDMEKGLDEQGNEVDIPGHDQAFFEPIKRLKDRGVIGGFGDGSFKPGNKVKKAELLKMALGAAGEEVDFEGEDPGAKGKAVGLGKSPKWHRILWNKAKEAGVLEDYDRTPDKEATRGETVRWVLRAYGIPVMQGAENEFSDVPSDSPDVDAITTAKKLGIVGGVSSDRFLPDGKVTRAEMAKIIANTEAALEKIDPETGLLKTSEPAPQPTAATPAATSQPTATTPAAAPQPTATTPAATPQPTAATPQPTATTPAATPQPTAATP